MLAFFPALFGAFLAACKIVGGCAHAPWVMVVFLLVVGVPVVLGAIGRVSKEKDRWTEWP